MRLGHFETLRPRCPVCAAAPLVIASSLRQSGDDLLEGILACANSECMREYPVIDGIPVIVAGIRAWLAANPLQVLARLDLSPEIESVIGDAFGPSSTFDTLRQHVGMYAFDHYGDLDPQANGDGTGNTSRLLSRALDSIAALPDGPALDVGCSVGRTTFLLAERLQRLTVGIDLNFAMLRVASQVLREQRVRYPRRRVGLVYERRDFAAPLPARELVDFWCCDAAALPFADTTFAVASSINVLDCVTSPRDALAELARVMRSQGSVAIATPYDWAPTATPVEHWLGGHSQRGTHGGAPEPVLRALTSTHFAITAEDERVPWRVRLHDRSAVDYAVHLVVGVRPVAVSR
jgi:SAM-dependent methyltransferase/uncharacterized protein YbaR (Trm112 family)